MSALTDVLHVRGLVRLMGAQLVARMPQGMLSIALLMHVQRVLGGYTAAGLAVAAFSVGAAVSGPLLGRGLVRLGARRVLGITLAGNALLTAVLAYGPHTLASLLPTALALGLLTPPILPIARSVYPIITPRGLLAEVYSLDSITQELIWIAGPVIVTLVVPAAGTSVGLLVVAALGLGGGLLVLTAPAVREARFAPSGKRLGRVLLKWPVLVTVVSGTLQNAGYGATETALVAMFADQGVTTGVIIAVFSLGSVLGGLLFSRVPMRPWSMATRQVALAVGTLAAAASTDRWWVGLTLFIAGMGTAPSLAVMYNVVTSSLRSADAAEAFGWLSSGLLAGIACGSSIGGAVIDAAGAQAALLVAGILCALAVLVPALTASQLPDLSRHSGPLTDTSAVPVIRLGRRAD
ncbi:MFS transporter [Pseudoclavibacter caeni]|jgi:MFS family permease|nr:MFS transporter [Pseudoclavibacter caeni]NYJ96267.1 MFS family permease [Pseudoclavibacter caeni]